MSTLHVEGSTSLTKAMQYLAEPSHNPDQCPERNLMMESNYSDPMRFFMEAEKRIDQVGHTRNEIYSIRLSFTREEFDPHSETDQYDALQLSKDFTETWLKEKQVNRPYLIALQADGDSGLLHSHIFVCNPGVDGHGIPKGASALRMQDLNDRVTKDFMLEHDRSTAVQDELIANKELHDHHSMGAATSGRSYGHSKDNAKAAENKMYMTKVLKESLKRSSTRDDFLRRIQQQGVYINQRANSSGNLWFNKGYRFKKSISIEYRGTKARTATLLGMNLQEIDQQLRKNFADKMYQESLRHPTRERFAMLDQMEAKRQKPTKHQPSAPVQPVKQKAEDKQQSAPVHVNRQELLNKKYQQLMELNRKLSQSNLTKDQREKLSTARDKVIIEVANLESALFVGETQKTIHRQQRIRKHEEEELEI